MGQIHACGTVLTYGLIRHACVRVSIAGDFWKQGNYLANVKLAE
jgi:hypothetical protein